MTTGAKQGTNLATTSATKSATKPAKKSNTKAAAKRVPKVASSRAGREAGHTREAVGAVRSPTDKAISTELAPAVAIALLNETEHSPGHAMPGLEPLAAGAVTSEVHGHVRVQLLFENGAVLPVELTQDAAAALGRGIEKELDKS